MDVLHDNIFRIKDKNNMTQSIATLWWKRKCIPPNYKEIVLMHNVSAAKIIIEPLHYNIVFNA